MMEPGEISPNDCTGLNKLLAEMRDFARENRVPILRKETAQLLEKVVCRNRPQRILEVGTAIGYSALLMLKSAGERCLVVTVEQDPAMALVARKFFRRAGIRGRVRLIGGDACEVLPCLEGPFDLVFFDANKAHYIDLLPHAERMLKRGGLLICDNVLFRGMVAPGGRIRRRKITIVKRLRRFLERLSCENGPFQTEVLPVGDGVSISRKIR